MTTNFRRMVCVLAACILSQSAARADVTSYAIFKVANYHQVDTTQPAGLDLPNAYYLGAQLFSTDEGEILTNAVFDTPTDTNYNMTGSPIPTAFFYNTPYYADDASFTADYPGGTYEFDANDDTDYGLMDEPSEELFTTSIPYFTADTWTRMQHVNAARPLNLCWNQFIPDPDASSAYIFVRILDPNFNYAYTTNFIPSGVTNICIPADSLEDGTTYQIQLLFSDRADNVGFGFESGAAATAGFDVLTYTSLVTGPPRLYIAPGTNTAVLSWSIAASNYSLESTTELSSSTVWCPVINAVTTVNNRNEVIVPTCGAARYYQLYQP